MDQLLVAGDAPEREGDGTLRWIGIGVDACTTPAWPGSQADARPVAELMASRR